MGTYTAELINGNDTGSDNHVFLNDELMGAIFDTIPFACCIWNEQFEIIDCNAGSVKLFGAANKQMYLENFRKMSPKHQPDGMLSGERNIEYLKVAFETGRTEFEWLHQTLSGDPIPTKKIYIRAKNGDGHNIISYTQDMRELKNAMNLLTYFEKLAFTDSLTGIYNRRYFTESAQKVFAQPLSKSKSKSKNSVSISIIMLDLDKFKNINDTYGHAAGDEILKKMARVIRETLRSRDLFARYGGEEFIILARTSNQSSLEALAQRIRKTIEQTKFNYLESDISLTISLGVATWTDLDISEALDPLESLESVISNADEALYAAKRNGRNRVEFYQPTTDKDIVSE